MASEYARHVRAPPCLGTTAVNVTQPPGVLLPELTGRNAGSVTPQAGLTVIPPL